MTQIIRSGAFVQQCWAVHPLCVTVKRMADDRTVVLSCSSCKSAHHLTLGLVVSKDSAMRGASEQGPAGSEVSADSLLGTCLATHHTSVTLRKMDVLQDLVLLRCADCRRHYELTVSTFETHQR
jgi:hypothetical protein